MSGFSPLPIAMMEEPRKSIESDAHWDSRRDWTRAGIAAALAFLLYLPTVGFDFIWDDRNLILENPTVTHPTRLADVFRADRYEFKINDANVYYRPVTTLTFILDHSLWGLRPAGYHFTNVVLHAGVTALVYGLILLLTQRRNWAFLAALFFACHPIHAEAVTWVKCRSELLAALFGVSGFLSAVTAMRRGRLWILPASLLFLFAVMAKQTALGLVPMLFAYAWLFAPPGERKRWLLRGLPVVVVALGFTVVDLAVLSKEATASSYSGIPLTWWRRILIVFQTLSFYGQWLVAPWGLSPHHDLIIPERPFTWTWIYVLPVVAVGAVSVRLAWHREWLGFGLLWTVVVLLPSSNLLPISGRIVAEQRAYLPSIGFCLMLACLVAYLGEGSIRSRWAWLPKAASAAVCALYAALAVSAYRIWSDPVRFWEIAHAKSPGKLLVLRNLSAELIHHGQPERALGYANQILKGLPDDATAWVHRGVALHDLGRVEEAATALFRAFELQPELPSTPYRLAVCYSEMNELGEAEGWLRKTLELDPTFIEAKRNLADLLRATGRSAAAIPLYREVVEDSPGSAAAHQGLGMALCGTGQYQPALDALHEAARLAPEDPRVRMEAGRVFLLARNPAQAAAHLKASVQLGPANLEAWLLLAQALEAAGDPDTARNCLEQAATIAPEVAEPSYRLGVWHLGRDQLPEASAAFTEALRREPGHASSLIGLGDVAQLSSDLLAAASAYARVPPERSEFEEASARRCDVLIRSGEFAPALEVAIPWIERLDPSVRFYTLSAKAYIGLGSPEEAWQTYLRFRDSSPPDLKTMLAFAQAYEGAGLFDRAVEVLQGVLAGQPTEPSALDILVAIALENRRLEAAMSALRKALSLAPDTPRWLQNLGVLEGMAGNMEASIRTLSRAAELSHDNPAIWFNLASAYLHAGQPVDAERSCVEGLRRDPGSERGLYLAALATYRLGAATDALRWVDDLLRRNPEHSEGKLLRDRIMTGGDPDEAPIPLSPH